MSQPCKMLKSKPLQAYCGFCALWRLVNWWCLSLGLTCCSAGLAWAELPNEPPSVTFAIPAQPLDSALLLLAAQANVDLLVPSILAAKVNSPGLTGRMSLTQALDALLRGSGLAFHIEEQRRVTVFAQNAPLAVVPPVPAPEHSPTAKPPTFTPTEEVIVTATRRASDLQKTPVAITVIGPAAISEHQAKDVRDLLNNVPSLEVANNSDQAALLIHLRGIGQTNITEIADDPVAMHIDGVYSPRFQGAAVPLFDLNRVEILRGPQGTLFGRNAIAGSINIHTQQPELDRLAGDATLSSGNYQRRALKGAINLPLGNGLAVRLAAVEDSHAAYTQLLPNYLGLGPNYPTRLAQTSAFQQAQVGRGEGPEADRQAAWRLSGLWQLNTNSRWLLSYEHFKDTGTSVTELDPGLVEQGQRVTVSDTPSGFTLRNGTLRSRFDYANSQELTFSYIAGDAAMQRQQHYDRDKGREGDYEQRRTQSSRFLFNSHELQVMNSNEARLRWLAGLFYSAERNAIVYAIDQENADHTNILREFTGLSEVLFVQPDRRVTSRAVYSHATFDLTDSQHLSGGARLSLEKKADRGGRNYACREIPGQNPEVPGSLLLGAPSAADVFIDARMQSVLDSGYYAKGGTPQGISPDQRCWLTSINDNQRQWRKISSELRYEYEPQSNLAIYAAVASGFKSGQIQDGGDTALPEDVINYELGLKYSGWQEQLHINTALYAAYYANQQFSFERKQEPQQLDGDARQLPVTELGNINMALVRGLELEASLAVSSRTHLDLVANLMDATFTDGRVSNGQGQPRDLEDVVLVKASPNSLAHPLDTNINLTGNQLVRAPRWRYSLQLSHKTPLGFGTLTTLLRGNFSDRYYLDIYNHDNLAPGLDYHAPDGAQQLAVQNPYATYDITARFTPPNSHWSAEAFVHNASDEQIKSSSGTYITPKGFDAIYLPPRIVGLTVHWEFN